MKRTVLNKKYKIAIICMLVAVFCVIGFAQWRRSVSNVTCENEKMIIAVDAGHGGFDPGKVGVNQAIEKDINLSIALKLKDILTKEGFEVVMTREEDQAINSNGEAKTTKRADMINRVAMINASGAKAAVSIHQNSFTEESSHGAQVFYHPQSEDGKNMALVPSVENKRDDCRW